MGSREHPGGGGVASELGTRTQLPALPQCTSLTVTRATLTPSTHSRLCMIHHLQSPVSLPLHAGRFPNGGDPLTLHPKSILRVGLLSRLGLDNPLPCDTLYLCWAHPGQQAEGVCTLCLAKCPSELSSIPRRNIMWPVFARCLVLVKICYFCCLHS